MTPAAAPLPHHPQVKSWDLFLKPLTGVSEQNLRMGPFGLRGPRDTDLRVSFSSRVRSQVLSEVRGVGDE